MSKLAALRSHVTAALLAVALPGLALAQAQVAEGQGGGRGSAAGLVWLLVPIVMLIGLIAVIVATVRRGRDRGPRTPAGQHGRP